MRGEARVLFPNRKEGKKKGSQISPVESPLVTLISHRGGETVRTMWKGPERPRF